MTGHYLLQLRLPTATLARIGVRPAVPLAAGWYVYVGSAQGAGGLVARLGRHQQASKRPHWHIDWLTAIGQLEAIWVCVGATGRECHWATALVTQGGQRQPPRFGSGDCRCPGHLIHFATPPALTALLDTTGQPAFRPWNNAADGGVHRPGSLSGA